MQCISMKIRTTYQLVKDPRHHAGGGAELTGFQTGSRQIVFYSFDTNPIGFAIITLFSARAFVATFAIQVATSRHILPHVPMKVQK